MRALVTGAFGFAGYHLVEHLSREGDEVLGTHVEAHPAHTLCRAQRLDIVDASACIETVRSYAPDAIYHLAGVAFGPDVERNFQRGLEINVGGFINILKGAALAMRPIRVVLISSAEVYGKVTPDKLPLTEDTDPYPANDYGYTKLCAELAFRRYSQASQVRAVAIRAFNHIGVGQRPDFVVASFAQQLARIALKKAPPVISVGNLEARRDFSDVQDIVRGYRLAALKGSGTYNLCSGRAVSIQAILDELIQIAACKVDIVRDPNRMRPSDTPEVRGSPEKAMRELGWAGATTPLRTSLERIFGYWLEREKDTPATP